MDLVLRLDKRNTKANNAKENMRDPVKMKMITFNINHDRGARKSDLNPHVS